MSTPFKVPSKFDHQAEMLEFCEDLKSFTNIKDIYNQVQKDQDVEGFLKREEKIFKLKTLYGVTLRMDKKESVPPARKRRVNTERKKKGRKIKKNILRKIKDPKMIVHPDSIKVSLIDVFKQGLVQCPQLKRNFLVNSVLCEPKVDLTKKLAVNNLSKEKLPAKKQLVSSTPVKMQPGKMLGVKNQPLKKVPLMKQPLKKFPVMKQPLKKQPLVIKLDMKKLAAKKLKKQSIKKYEL